MKRAPHDNADTTPFVRKSINIWVSRKFLEKRDLTKEKNLKKA